MLAGWIGLSWAARGGGEGERSETPPPGAWGDRYCPGERAAAV